MAEKAPHAAFLLICKTQLQSRAERRELTRGLQKKCGPVQRSRHQFLTRSHPSVPVKPAFISWAFAVVRSGLSASQLYWRMPFPFGCESAVRNQPSRCSPVFVRFKMREGDRMNRVIESVLTREVKHKTHNVIALDRISALDITQH